MQRRLQPQVQRLLRDGHRAGGYAGYCTWQLPDCGEERWGAVGCGGVRWGAVGGGGVWWGAVGCGGVRWGRGGRLVLLHVHRGWRLCRHGRQKAHRGQNDGSLNGVAHLWGARPLIITSQGSPKGAATTNLRTEAELRPQKLFYLGIGVVQLAAIVADPTRDCPSREVAEDSVPILSLDVATEPRSRAGVTGCFADHTWGARGRVA